MSMCRVQKSSCLANKVTCPHCNEEIGEYEKVRPHLAKHFEEMPPKIEILREPSEPTFYPRLCLSECDDWDAQLSNLVDLDAHLAS